jgi:hypothetical protein
MLDRISHQVRVITVFTVFRLLTDFVCLYNYEFWLSLCKIARSSVILLLPYRLCRDGIYFDKILVSEYKLFKRSNPLPGLNPSHFDVCFKHGLDILSVPIKCKKYFFINVWRTSVFYIYFTEFGTALTTIWAVMKAGGLAL